MAITSEMNQNIAQRDIQLDIYRALIMIYILCIIHVGYWMNALPESMKSILLFEMPVIFYISGASLSVARKNRSLGSMIVNRAKRVLLPYYAYALVCVLAVIAYTLLFKKGNDMSTLSLFLNALWPQDKCLPIPYTWHLWFVLPYLIISCTFFFQRRIVDKFNKYLSGGVLLCLCILTQLITDNSLIRNVVFYNFFFISGYLFYKNITPKQICVIALIAIPCFIGLSLMCWNGRMQYHKFPPDMLFLTYGIVVLCAAGIALSYIIIPQNRMLNWWNRHGYTIYLWQNVSFIIVGMIIAFIPEAMATGIQGFMIKSILVFSVASILSFATVPYERILVDRLSCLFNKFVLESKSLMRY